MAEEQRCQEAHRLCANNCGFVGSPATLNLCSKCYSDHRLKEEHQKQLQAPSAAKVSVEKSQSQSLPASPSSAITRDEAVGPRALDASPLVRTAAKEDTGEAVPKAAEGPIRCASCRKRVGLTGFVCRCGDTFCGAHRYAERHGCTFDFKAAGRAVIARANPVVKADKLRKI